jgi:hypothetical protein
MFQRIQVQRNPATGLSVPQEGLLILLGRLADEMLSRACVLGWLTTWCNDRLLEADLPSVPAEGTAGWLALALVVSFEAFRRQKPLTRGLAVQAAVVNTDVLTGKPRVQTIAEDKVDSIADDAALVRSVARGKSADATSESDTAATLRRIQRTVSATKEKAATAAQIDALHMLAEMGVLGSAFVATGNLASSWGAAVTIDALFSSHQRKARGRRLAGARAERAERRAAAAEGGDGGA